MFNGNICLSAVKSSNQTRKPSVWSHKPIQIFYDEKLVNLEMMIIYLFFLLHDFWIMKSNLIKINGLLDTISCKVLYAQVFLYNFH